MIDESTEFGVRVAARLREETVVWLTTVTPSGAPLLRPVGFLWDGGDIVVLSGTAEVDESGATAAEDAAWVAKYTTEWERFGMTAESFAALQRSCADSRQRRPRVLSVCTSLVAVVLSQLRFTAPLRGLRIPEARADRLLPLGPSPHPSSRQKGSKCL